MGDIDRVRDTLTCSTKATWQLGNGHRIDASFFGDPSSGDIGPQRTSALLVGDTASFSSPTYGGHNQTLRYNGVLSNNWLLEASFARALNRISEVFSVNEWRVTDQTLTPTRISGGIGFYEVGSRGLNRQVAVKSTNISAHQPHRSWLEPSRSSRSHAKCGSERVGRSRSHFA